MLRVPLDVHARAPDGSETSLTPFYVRLFILPLPAQPMGNTTTHVLTPSLHEDVGGSDIIAPQIVTMGAAGAGEDATWTVGARPTTGHAEAARATLHIDETAGRVETPVARLATSEAQGAGAAPILASALPEAGGLADVLPRAELAHHEAGGHGERISILLPLTQAVGHATTKHLIQYESRDGASAASQEARGGRSDWTNLANASGKHNSTLASIQGSLTGPRGGRLVLDYADLSPILGEFTIRTVRLHFYVRQQGTAANNGSLVLAVRRNGETTTLETITSNVDNLATPRTFDITLEYNTWARLDELDAYCSFISQTGETYSADCDAVELEILADRTY